MADFRERVQQILTDIRTSHSAKLAPEKTLFYKVVLGGNASHVKMVLWRLAGEDRHLLDWLLNRPAKIQRKANCLLQLVGCVLCATLWTVLSPCFYLLHVLVTRVLLNKRRRLGQDIRLPLAFAALSYKPDVMIKLFQEYGVTVCQTDAEGNNVFHYLADASRSKPKSTITAFKTVCAAYGAMEVRELCMQRPNNLGLNVLEHCIRFGSFEMFDLLITADGMLKRVTFRASEPPTCPGTDEAMDSTGAFSETSRYDVTDYEKGDWMGKQSLLIHLLTGRDLLSEAEREVRTMQQITALEDWINMKVKMTKPFVVFLHVGSLLLTALIFMYIVNSEGDYKIVPLAENYLDTYTEVTKELYAEYITANNVLDSHDIYDDVCPANSSVIASRVLDKCLGATFYRLAETCGIDVETTFGYTDLQSSVSVIQLEFLNDVLMPVSRMFMFIAVAYLALDIFFRLSAIARVFSSRHMGFGNALRFLHTFPLPGSYTAKITNTLMCQILIVYYQIGNRLKAIDLSTTDTYETFIQVEQSLSNTIVTVIICRIIAHIHTMRLLPGIGYFVVTTFTMAATLLRFIIIYGIVLCTFSFIFSLLIRDPACSLHLLPQFQTFSGSVFETFKLLLGHGDFYFEGRTSVRWAYVVYIIICVFLLLNLIIGIMSTIATQVMSNPWRHALWKNEIIKESLSTEALLLFLTAPFSCCLRPILLRWVGFVVSGSVCKRKGVTTKTCTACYCCGGKNVFIECFHKAEETDAPV